MVVTFDTFFSVDWICVGRSGSGICNITSLILCRDNMGREELIPRFRTSIHLYQWDPENPCCMAQTSWLLVNQMSIFFQSFGALTLSKKPFSKRRLSCVADMGFLKGKKNNKIFKKDPSYYLTSKIPSEKVYFRYILVVQRHSQQVFGVFGCLGYWSRLVFFFWWSFLWCLFYILCKLGWEFHYALGDAIVQPEDSVLQWLVYIIICNSIFYNVPKSW